MKRISIYLFFLFASLSAYSQEWVRASINNGPSPNSTALFINTNTEFDANKCDNIVFTVRVPISAGPSVVVAESYHDASISHITFNIQKLNVDDGAYYYYLINGTGTVQAATGIIYGINTPYKLLELTYSGGITNGIVQLANIENDIPGNSFLRPQFYIQINVGDITNQTSMFYGTGTAVPVNNQPVTGDDFVGTSSSVLLPVKFLSFTAVKAGNNADLSWNVQNESAITDHYEIERSLNGSSYEKTGIVPAKNNGNSSNSYTATDINLSALRTPIGKVFYKIKQVDKDGRFVYTEVRSVRVDGRAFDVSVYPNPVVSTSRVDIDLAEASKVNIILIDAAGKEVQAAVINAVKGLNVYTLNMNKLASGTYVVKVVAANETRNIPVVKKK